MYSVLLVDDEPMIKMSLRNAIDWQKHGYELSGSCNDGKEALDFIERQPVDIVITDLNMPAMDGIELIHALKDKRYTGSVLVLSNYSDFTLVRKALTAGALDYLLKVDINEATLLQQLGKAAAAVDENRKKQQEERKRAQHTRLIEKQLLLNYLTGVEALPSAQMSIIRNSPFYSDSQQVMYILPYPGPGSEIRQSTLEHAAKLIYTLCGEQPWIEAAITPSGGILVLVYNQKYPDVEIQYNELAEKISRNIALYFNIACSVALPAASKGLAHSRDKVILCHSAMQINFYGHQDFIIPETIAFTELPANTDVNAIAKAGLVFGTMKYPKELPDVLKNLAEGFQAATVQPECVKKFFHDVLQKERELAGNLGSAFSFDAHTYTGFTELIEGYIDAHNVLVKASIVESGGRYESQIIIEYLKNHLAEHISLDELADTLNLNRSYVSRLFKQQTGSNIFVYLSNLRMEKAAVLLREGRHYVKEIASMVGYTDSLYFTRMFTKHFGMSPTQYVHLKSGDTGHLSTKDK